MKHTLFIFIKRLRLDYPKQIQDDEDERNDDQGVNCVAEFGESRRHSWSEKAEQPQH